MHVYQASWSRLLGLFLFGFENRGKRQEKKNTFVFATLIIGEISVLIVSVGSYCRQQEKNNTGDKWGTDFKNNRVFLFFVFVFVCFLPKHTIKTCLTIWLQVLRDHANGPTWIS